MTLANGLVLGSKAFLWTDTAWWNPAKEQIVAHASKAFMLETFPAAGVLSLHGENPCEVAAAIGSSWPMGVDGLLSATAEALRAYCCRGGLGRVLIASNLGGPRLFIVSSDGAGLGRPFEPVELAHIVSSGNRTPAYLEAASRGFTLDRMRRVIDAQLTEPFEGEGGVACLGQGVWIGGNIVEVIVTASGVESRVLREAQKQESGSCLH